MLKLMSPTLLDVYLNRTTKPDLCILTAAAHAWLAWNEHIEMYDNVVIVNRKTRTLSYLFVFGI